MVILQDATGITDTKTQIEVGGKDMIRVAVEDDGCGIPEDVLPHIFDPFFTTKPPGEGTGLGLSLSFDLVHRLGGTLNVSNIADGGARFEVWLPAAPDELLPLEA